VGDDSHTAEGTIEARRLRLLLDQAPAFVFVMRGPDLVVELLNGSFARLIDRNAEELVGRPAAEALADYADQYLATWQNVFRTGEAFHGTSVPTVVTTRSGAAEQRFFDFVLVPLRDESGRIDGVMNFGFEVTAQVHARHRAEELERQYRVALDALPIVAWTNGPDNRIEFMNERFTELTGIPADRANEAWASVVHPDDLAVIAASFDPVQPDSWQLEYRLRRKDGAYRWHLGRSVAVSDAQGRIVQRFGTATDIHDRRMADERQRFLADAAARLAANSDAATALREIAENAVPSLIDGLLVHLTTEDGPKLVAIAHRDPEQRRLLEASGDAAVARLEGATLLPLPLASRGGQLGTVTLASTTAFDEHDVRFGEDLARVVASAIEGARLLAAEQRAAMRATAFQELTVALRTAHDSVGAARAVVELGRELLGALSSVVWLAASDGALELAAAKGVPEDFLAAFTRIEPGSELPAMRSLTTREPIWVSSVAEYRQVSAEIAERAVRNNRPTAYAAVPLANDRAPLGVAVFGFAAPHVFNDEEKKLVATICGHTSQALERARLQQMQVRSLASLRIVARAGEMLSASLDIDATLTALAEAAVPDVADWCAIDMLADGEVRRLTVQHSDPNKLALAQRYAERFPTRIDDPRSTVARILRTGETVWTRRIDAAMVRATFDNPEQRDLLLELGLRSTVMVPLTSEGRVRGVVTFIMAESGREYDEADRDLLVDLGRRASLALTNALLYARERRARERLAVLAAAGETFSGTIDYEETLDAVVRTALPALGDFGFFDVVEDDGVRRTSRAHEDPEVGAILAQSRWSRSERTDINLCGLSSGKPALHGSIDDAFLRDMAVNEGHLAVLRALRLCSMITVPVISRGAVIGALTLCYGRSGRHHTQDDLELTQELARRGGIAVEQARLYQSSREAARRAEEANRVKDEFLATVSHELRTPLNAIVGWSHMLRGDKLRDFDFVTRGVDVIRRNAQSQKHIVDDILDVSRIIAGKLRITPAPVDLRTVVRDALDVVRPAADAKNVRITVADGDAPVPLLADGARLQQIVWNLLSNAVKFTPAGGRVSIALAPANDTVTIRVVDTGQGIDPEFLPHVFDRFKQADSSSTRAHGGLGLGLAIVRHLVELHGGTVTARSEGLGRGATFEVLLPVQPARAGDTAKGAAPESAPLAGARILVVDDDRDSRELVCELLRAAGANVHVAASADDAMRAAIAALPDLVVSDIAMPDRDGYALVAELRAAIKRDAAPLRVVALTAYGRDEDRAAAARAGFDAHLTKPVDPSELVRTVRRLLRTH